MSNFTNTEDISFINFYPDMQNNQTKRVTNLDYIFVDNDNAHFCRKTESHFNLFKQPLVECTLELSTWRLDQQLLEVSSITKEIQQKLTSISKVTASEWNNIKMHIQSIFRTHPALKKTMQKKLNKKTSNTILNKLFSDLDIDLTHLNPEIKEELIKDGWIKGKEKSTLKIRDPSSPSENPADILIYIKNHYKKLFEKKSNDFSVANIITNNLPKVTPGQNQLLTKEITVEEISEAITNLKAGKAPGIDGLTHEFYKHFQNELIPILKQVFNEILSTSLNSILPEDKYPELEENQQNRVLGFYIDKKGRNAKDLWQKKIKDIEEAIHKVDKINKSTNEKKLSSEGRKQIVRTFLSKIWHTSYLQPPTNREIIKLSTIIAQWINYKCLTRNDIFNQLKDMFNARLGIIWIKLLSSDCLWANEERKSIETNLFCKMSISAAINSIDSYVWPSKWRPYFIAWKRLNGKVPLAGSWPWNQNLIEIAGIKADEYSVMFAVEYLEKIRKYSRCSKHPKRLK
ncbi:28360_t:CDS:2, partial [Dentiscutata erythropus]